MAEELIDDMTVRELNLAARRLGGKARFDRFCRGELILVVDIYSAQPFMALAVGDYTTVEEYRTALTEDNILITKSADPIVDKILVCGREMTFDLIVASVADLGFPDYAHYDKLCQRAVQIGLELCSAELALAFRNSYTDQPAGENLHVAMEPIEGSDGLKKILVVGCDEMSNSKLDTDDGRPDIPYEAPTKFLFVRPPRKK